MIYSLSDDNYAQILSSYSIQVVTYELKIELKNGKHIFFCVELRRREFNHRFVTRVKIIFKGPETIWPEKELNKPRTFSVKNET